MDEEIVSQASSIFSQYLTMLADPIFAIPLLAAWVVGFFVSQSGWVVNCESHSKRKFRVYLTNAVVAALLFNLLTSASTVHAMIQLTILISSVAVVVPFLWFEVFRKKRK